MAFGKLYTYAGNSRSTAIRAVAKANSVDLQEVEVDTTKPTEEFLKANPPPQVASQNEKTTLLGKTKQDYASILRWMSFFNSEVLPKFGGWFRPLVGKDPYNKKSVEESEKAAIRAISVVETHLRDNTYLVGERITLADIFAVGIISRGFEYFFGKEWRQQYPNVSRWYSTVYNQPIYSAVAPEFSLLDTPKLTNVAPKKPEQPKKEAPKPAPLLLSPRLPPRSPPRPPSPSTP
ncbi:elongation factor EF-1 gamma subunit [Collariella sp. IMI 366227]|nr:elongation factor EF-1 gamma subunit [Collariella sp. IMI 366227]